MKSTGKHILATAILAVTLPLHTNTHAQEPAKTGTVKLKKHEKVEPKKTGEEPVKTGTVKLTPNKVNAVQIPNEEQKTAVIIVEHPNLQQLAQHIQTFLGRKVHIITDSLPKETPKQ